MVSAGLLVKIQRPIPGQFQQVWQCVQRGFPRIKPREPYRTARPASITKLHFYVPNWLIITQSITRFTYPKLYWASSSVARAAVRSGLCANAWVTSSSRAGEPKFIHHSGLTFAPFENRCAPAARPATDWAGGIAGAIGTAM